VPATPANNPKAIKPKEPNPLAEFFKESNAITNTYSLGFFIEGRFYQKNNLRTCRKRTFLFSNALTIFVSSKKNIILMQQPFVFYSHGF
jgi:hypothetical protein